MTISTYIVYLHFTTKEDLSEATVAHALGTSLAAARTADLFQTSHALLGPLIAQHEARFTFALAKALRAARMKEAYKSTGLTARQLAATLNATARGLKFGATSRATFVAGFRIAVRALCTPLRSLR